MWFKSNHHQSVGNSLSFLVGPEIPKFGVFIAFQSMKPYREEWCHVKVFINGEAEEEESNFDANLKYMCDLNIWLKPYRFPVLESLNLSDSNIVTIPESITKFTRLQFLSLDDCKQLQEIPRLPHSIDEVDADNCRSLDLQSSRRLFDQVSFYLSIIVTFLNYV